MVGSTAKNNGLTTVRVSAFSHGHFLFLSLHVRMHLGSALVEYMRCLYCEHYLSSTVTNLRLFSPIFCPIHSFKASPKYFDEML